MSVIDAAGVVNPSTQMGNPTEENHPLGQLLKFLT